MATVVELDSFMATLDASARRGSHREALERCVDLLRRNPDDPILRAFKEQLEKLVKQQDDGLDGSDSEESSEEEDGGEEEEGDGDGYDDDEGEDDDSDCESS